MLSNNIVQVRYQVSLAGEKLVRYTEKSCSYCRHLVIEEALIKGQGRGVWPAHLPLHPLLTLYESHFRWPRMSPVPARLGQRAPMVHCQICYLDPSKIPKAAQEYQMQRHNDICCASLSLIICAYNMIRMAHSGKTLRRLS